MIQTQHNAEYQQLKQEKENELASLKGMELSLPVDLRSKFVGSENQVFSLKVILNALISKFKNVQLTPGYFEHVFVYSHVIAYKRYPTIDVKIGLPRAYHKHKSSLLEIKSNDGVYQTSPSIDCKHLPVHSFNIFFPTDEVANLQRKNLELQKKLDLLMQSNQYNMVKFVASKLLN